MTDHNLLPRSKDRRSSQRPVRSLSPSSAMNQTVVLSRHPYIKANSSRRSSMRSTSGLSSSHSHTRQLANGQSSIQMEPGLQALLAAENRAAKMIATARTKRNELMRQANRESQAEIEAFRQEREALYKVKLQEATQLEQFQTKLDTERDSSLKQMEGNVRKERRSLIKYIIHLVAEQIPVKPHSNTKRVIF